MNIILLAFLAICEIVFAGIFVWEVYRLMCWLDRRVFSPLLSKLNDLILQFYVRHLTEEWLFWERRREEAHGIGHESAGEAAESIGSRSGSGDDPAPGS